MSAKKIKQDLCLLGWAIPKELMDDKNEEEVGEIFVKLMWSGLSRQRTTNGALFLGLPATLWVGGGNEEALKLDIQEILKAIGFDVPLEEIDWECNWMPE